MSVLELSVVPADATALMRMPGLQRSGRATPVHLLWHDTPAGTLADRALTVCHDQGQWRLEALRPGPAPWPPATPTPIVAEADSLRLLGLDGEALTPVAALQGQRRRFILPTDVEAEPVHLIVLTGALRGVAAEEPVCRVSLSGPDLAVQALAATLAQSWRVSVPRGGLGAEAVAIARGQTMTARHLGAPSILPNQPLTDSIALIVGQLLDVMLHWSGPACAGTTPVGVHQMRVATRRLRSALTIFRTVAVPNSIATLAPSLRELAACLGAARDWDVFLAGTGADVQAAFPDDRRVRALLAGARRQRETAYGALRTYLTGPVFRSLEISLGCAVALRPWDHVATATDDGTAGGPVGRACLQQDTAVFATTVLARRHKRVVRGGRHVRSLPTAALHELRKECKRLRYAAEFFQPLYPDKVGRRYIRALGDLQEQLGVLNDAAVAASLMQHLGRAERGYAAGLVGGFVAASSGQQRSGIVRCWRRFRRCSPFWTES